VTTFLRLPHVGDLTGVDLAVVGLPFESGTDLTEGASFGPRAVREGSLSLRPLYNVAQRVAVFERLSAVDHGDATVVTGAAGPSLEAFETELGAVHRARVVPLGLGGDRTVLVAELRAAAAAHGPLALVLFTAEVDSDDVGGEPPENGTPVRRAIDEGLIDARRSTILGLRGGAYGPDDDERLRELGFDVFPWDDLVQLGSGAVAAAVERAAGKAFLSFDIDFVDPAFAPGTGAPRCGGPTSAQALALVRACRGLEIAAADVVGVVPDRDVSRLTGTLAATVAWEIMSLVACEAGS
jgi:agmatinase